MELLRELWNSFLGLPFRVRVWLVVLLVPANLVVLLFLDEPFARVVLALCLGGLVPNAVMLVRDRRFTTTMAIPHAIFWTPLVALLIYVLFGASAELSAAYRASLSVLLIVNGLSLVADIPDAWRRLHGVKTVF